MQEKKMNRGALKSIQAIKGAFFELMKTKDVSKIKVSEIVKIANIDRSTFYEHYCDIYAIVEEIQKSVLNEVEKIIRSFKTKVFFDKPYDIMKELTDYLMNNKELLSICIKNQDVMPFFDKMTKIFSDGLLESETIREIDEPMQIKKSKLSFMAGGVVFSYIKWLKNEIPCSLEELTEIFISQERAMY